MVTKVLFFGTHPACYNGYCLVTYNLAKQLALKDDIELIIYGFQGFYSHPQHNKERELPSNVYIYDAHANETPKALGFGFEQVKDFVDTTRPDVCVVYNDMVVVDNILKKLREVPNPTFKLIVYIDQVYLYQRAEYVKLLNEQADYVLCFTPYWEQIAKDIGITKPTGYLQHGFDPMVNYPVPKMLARQHFGLKKDDFIIMNLNRNQPRKRWDVCLMAFAEVVSRHQEEPIKLMIATALNGAWNLMEVYERELKKRGMTLEEGMKHIIVIDNPQQLTDEAVNILYNVANMGINTCDGEGFGLCNFQQAAIGIPQVVPNIGGFLDFFNSERASVVEPKWGLYLDAGRDGVGGETQICDYMDIANAIDEIYTNQEEAARKVASARKYICENYKWSDIGEKFRKILKEVHGVQEVKEVQQKPVVDKVSMKLIEQWESELNNVVGMKESLNEPPKGSLTDPLKGSLNEPPKGSLTDPLTDPLKGSLTDPLKDPLTESLTDPLKEDPQPAKKKVVKKKKAVEDVKTRLKNKLKEKEELLAMREKIDKLLLEK